MSETTERRPQVPTADFVKAYVPLQKQGLTRAEIAAELDMVDSEGKFDGFNTKLSNAKLELFVGTCRFETPDGEQTGGVFAAGFRDVMRQLATEAAANADYSGAEDPVAAKEKAIDKANKITTMDAMREIRNRIDNGELVPSNSKVKRNTAGGIIELPNPVGGRQGRDLAALGDAVAELLA